MPAKAPRQPQGAWLHRTRGALLGLLFVVAGTNAVAACGVSQPAKAGAVQNSVVTQGDFSAWYSDLTSRYGHAVLGDALEPTTLTLSDTSCGMSVTLERPHVFEDIAPRLIDLTDDGVPELIAVRSHESKGAQLAIYTSKGDALELLATTPYIGTRNRWLAPVGAADLDGDGKIEIAFVDRPHLAKTLRVWRYESGALEQTATLVGVTNHRIGEDFITGGIRDCGSGPEMILATANWRDLIAIRLSKGGTDLSAETLAPFSSQQAVQAALDCEN